MSRYSAFMAFEYFVPSLKVCPTSMPLKNSVFPPQRGQASSSVAERRSKKPLILVEKIPTDIKVIGVQTVLVRSRHAVEDRARRAKSQ